MILSRRLHAIAALIPQDSILADIGCDHGLLPIYLAQQKVIAKAYACDVNEGPLARAKEAIDGCELSGTISTILTDGLSGLPNDVTVIVIAGMGHETICKILEDHLDLLNNRQIIIQSNTDIYEMRKWIVGHEYRVLDDFVIYDRHFYHILKFDTKKGREAQEDELLFGFYQTSPDFLDYCRFEVKKVEKIIAQMSDEHENFNSFIYYKESLIKKIKEKMGDQS